MEECRNVQKLIWTSIKEILPIVEINEIKTTLDTSIIEENQLLFNEATNLSELIEQFKLNYKFNNYQIPNNQKLIENEIHIYLEKLENNSIIPNLTETDKKVIQYIKSSASKNSSRPSSSSSELKNNILDLIKSNFNIFNIDNFKETLIKAFEEEKQALIEDIQYLNECIETFEIPSEMPCKSELNEFGNKIRLIWMEHEMKNENKEKLNTILSKAKKKLPPIKKLHI